MGIPVVRGFSASVSGAECKAVSCEQCGKDFVYQAKRKGHGDALSPLFLGEEQARKRAKQQAERALAYSLRNAIDIVPCPGCGWIQSNMHSLARQKHLPRFKIAGIALLCVASAPIFILIATCTFAADKPLRPRAFGETLILAVCLVVLGIALLIYRHIECKHFDPNSCDLDVRLRDGGKLAILREELERLQKGSI